MLHPDRLFPVNENVRVIAREIFSHIEKLPLICPHGHTEPQWFAENETFSDPTELIIIPDHYVLRMLVSQGYSLSELGIPSTNGAETEADRRKIWNIFAQNYHLYRATPSRLWLDYTFENLFGIETRLSPDNANDIYDRIADCLTRDDFTPRAIYDRFNIELIATTDACTDDLDHHRNIAASDWGGRVIPTYRPDAALDPDHPDFMANIALLADQTGEDTTTWQGYLSAHRARRGFFKSMGATATDHGHPTALTADLGEDDAKALYSKILSGKGSAADHELFRAQMLTEMAGMSVDDGLVMQIHAGSYRNHSDAIFNAFGRDKGFDIPKPVSFVSALKPLLDKYGLEKNLSIILFTLDETVYSRELAPLAGAYPCLTLGPAWWFHDSAEGMMRFRQMSTETAGFYNTAGFNDDTRALPSILARHDVARRVDSAFLADQVAKHILDRDEAIEIAIDLTYNLPKKAYRL